MEKKNENQSIEQKTKARVNTRTAMSVALLTGGFFLVLNQSVKSGEEFRENSRFFSIMMRNVEYDEVTKSYTFNDPSIELKEANSTKILMTGEEIIFRYAGNELRDIRYCKILDEYYTINGENIAVCEVAKKTLNVVPSEYTFETTRTRCYVVEKDGKYELPVGYILDNIVEIIESKPYSELIDYDLVIKSGEEYYVDAYAEKIYETEMILKKHK